MTTEEDERRLVDVEQAVDDASSGAVIEVRDLRKRYGDNEALRGVSFCVNRGEVFALLGPNGAGKTTTIEILEGHRRPTSGDARVLGVDPRRGGVALRQRIGIVLQEAGIDVGLTVGEALRLFAGFYTDPMPPGDALALAGLEVRSRARIGSLSGGQRRRLDLALGLVGNPDLLFLDEPTTGFDPAARRQAWDTLRDLVALRKTILLTSHYMDEVQALADRVAVMAAGRVVAEGSPSTLGGRDVREAVVRFRPSPRRPFEPGAVRVGAGERAVVDGGTVTITTRHPTALLRDLCAWADGEELDALTVTRPTLEDVYLRLVEDVTVQGDVP